MLRALRSLGCSYEGHTTLKPQLGRIVGSLASHFEICDLASTAKVKSVAGRKALSHPQLLDALKAVPGRTQCRGTERPAEDKPQPCFSSLWNLFSAFTAQVC